jgi:hypothetical protein
MAIWDRSQEQIDSQNKVEKPLTQPPELSKQANEVEDFFAKGLSERYKYERQWYLNMAYFLGYQWVRWNTTTRTLQMTVDPDHRKRITVNKIMPAVMKEIGRMERTRPTFFAIPDDNTEECKEMARFSEDVLDFLDREINIPARNQDLRLLTTVFGCAYKLHFWNPFAGELTDDGQGGQINIGEVDQEILSPFQVVMEAGCTSIDDCTKVIIVKQRSTEWIKKRYPEWGHLVQAEVDKSTSSLDKQLNSIMQNYVMSGSQDGNKSPEDKSGYVNVKEYRMLPTEEFPNGKILIVANKIVLASGDLPLQYQIRDKKFGLLQYDYIKVPGRPYGRSYIEDLIPPQQEYNKTLSQIIEHRNQFKGKWLKAKGMQMSPAKPNSEPGEVIEYTVVPGAGKPEMVAPPPLPAYLEQILQRCILDMQDITSQHEISKAQTPPGITAGVAIQTLAELDDTQYSTVHTRFENNECESAMQMLEIVKEKYDEVRKLAMVGENNELQVTMFDQSKNIPTKVIVQRGSSLPQTKAARIATVLELADRGFIDKNDRKKIFKLIEFGSIAEEIDEQTMDEKRAQLENSRVITETPLIVESFDEHPIHILTHNKMRKSVQYEKFTPEQKQKIDIHVAEHGGVMSGDLVKDTVTGRWMPNPQPMMPQMGLPGEPQQTPPKPPQGGADNTPQQPGGM